MHSWRGRPACLASSRSALFDKHIYIYTLNKIKQVGRQRLKRTLEGAVLPALHLHVLRCLTNIYIYIYIYIP
jgi:hypothetical protein